MLAIPAAKFCSQHLYLSQIGGLIVWNYSEIKALLSEFVMTRATYITVLLSVFLASSVMS